MEFIVNLTANAQIREPRTTFQNTTKYRSLIRSNHGQNWKKCIKKKQNPIWVKIKDLQD